MPKSKKTPPDENTVYFCKYKVKGKDIPQEPFEKYAVDSAKKTGTRGYILKGKKGIYKGRLEGQKQVLEGFKELMQNPAEFKDVLEKVAFRKLKKIKTECQSTIFEVKVKVKKPKKVKTKENNNCAKALQGPKPSGN